MMKSVGERTDPYFTPRYMGKLLEKAFSNFFTFNELVYQFLRRM